MNYKKNKRLFPDLQKSGPTMWGAVIRYECVDCLQGYQGNVGTVLVCLDSHVK
jgi:hypothetical protein